MENKYIKIVCMVLAGISVLTGCGSQTEIATNDQTSDQVKVDEIEGEEMRIPLTTPTEQIVELEDGLSVVRFDGNDGFDTFLQNGGAQSDAGVIEYLTNSMLNGVGGLVFEGTPFGCSTISVANEAGEHLFGRNFDWYHCDALIVASYPENAYASISTVNTNFITQGVGSMSAVFSADNVMKIAALYAPIDGMNEEGLAVSVNMIQDSDTIEQNTDKPDITTTTAVRMLLNQAANVEEAIELLESYDLHASFGLMVHFAISDAQGNSVVVEYVNQEMVVTKTPVVTNFYLAEGEKNGIGTSQSHTRYDVLMTALERGTLSETEVRDALDSVSKHNYNDGETTEWSIVFNQDKKEAVYYHRENFEQAYRIQLDD